MQLNHFSVLYVILSKVYRAGNECLFKSVTREDSLPQISVSEAVVLLCHSKSVCLVVHHKEILLSEEKKEEEGREFFRVQLGSR